jgi:hypothetical protein
MPEQRSSTRSPLIWFLVISLAVLALTWLSFRNTDDSDVPSPTATWTRAEPPGAPVTSAPEVVPTTEPTAEVPEAPTEVFSPLPEASPLPTAYPPPAPFATPTPVSYPLPTLPPPTPYPAPEGG